MTKRVVIAGDSWGKGEWTPCDPPGSGKSEITHRGLEQYLIDDGHEVYNISHGGISNQAIVQRIESWMSKFHDRGVDMILVFQTEYVRDQDLNFFVNWDQVTRATDLADVCLSRMYARLSEISIKYNVPIYLIGGVVDTMWLDRWHEHYPGVTVICQSMYNLILHGDPRIEYPVYSWYSSATEEIVKRLKKHLPSHELEHLLALLAQGFYRQSSVFETPQYFWPDGMHSNRHGYLILYKFLQDQKLFN